MTSTEGLSSSEAESRMRDHGPNAIGQAPRSMAKAFLLKSRPW
ncbi:cation-transporting P-type ATPase [Sulfuricaulis sp.]|jgi:hypothetical protein